MEAALSTRPKSIQKLHPRSRQKLFFKYLSPWMSSLDTCNGTRVPYIYEINFNLCSVRYQLISRPRFATVAAILISTPPLLDLSPRKWNKGPASTLKGPPTAHVSGQPMRPSPSNTMPRGIVVSSATDEVVVTHLPLHPLTSLAFFNGGSLLPWRLR